MKRNKTRLLALLLALSTALLTLSGCSNSGAPAAAGSQPPAQASAQPSAQAQPTGGDSSTLTWALSSDIVALDPIYAYDNVTNLVIIQITEGLLSFDSSNKLVPCLASGWEAVDATTYVYQIRDDVTFSDGSPMTMEDVLFSLNRNMGASSASYLSWMFGSVASIEQTGDWELTVHLSQPDALWQYTLATCGGHILSKKFCEANPDFGSAAAGILGTGPYKLDHWTNGSEIVLTPNENYWDGGFHFDFDKLVYNIIVEDTTRIQALKAGQVDYVTNVPFDMIDQVEGVESLDLSLEDSFGIEYLSFNTQRAPFNDANVRKAVAYATDAHALVDSIFGQAGAYPTGLMFVEDMYLLGDAADWKAYADGLDYYSYNIDKAKECMAASAYPGGFECTLVTYEASYMQSIALYLQACLSELGITVNIERMTIEEVAAIQNGDKLDANGVRDFDLAILEWYADFPDPAGNMQPLLSSSNAGEGGSNSAGYINAEADALLQAQNASIDAAERGALLRQVNDLVLEDMPYYVLCYAKTPEAKNARIAEIQYSPMFVCNWNLLAKNFKLA